MGRKKRRNKRRYQRVEYYALSPETKKGISVVFLFVLAVIAILSFLNLAGSAGYYVDLAFGIVFGWGRFIIPIILIILGYALARTQRYEVTIPNYIGVGLFVLSIHGLLHLKLPMSTAFELIFSGLGGGIVGYLISYPLQLYLGLLAGTFILIGLFLASILLMFNTGIENILQKTNIFKLFQPVFKRNRPDGDEDEDEQYNDEEEYEDDDGANQAREVKFASHGFLKEKTPEKRVGIKTSTFKVDLPLNLLDPRISKPTSGDIKMGTEKIKKTLENFNIDVEMGDVQVGPTVTQYTLRPSEGVKLSKIIALNNDLALALAAHPIRIEAPIPGKSLVGVEVPNQKPAMVRIREVLNSPQFKQRKSNLEIGLGKDVSGRVWTANLQKMPHLLVAGATGSGKSVCLNSIIIHLLYQNNPDTLRFILVDPKRVEFPIYNGIPHLLTPVITDVTKTVYSLRWAISEMDRRFDVLAQVKKRNLESYNLTAKEKMPYIVIIIDELADLMVAAAAEVEGCIIRLTQMARAVGIHMVVATQRPSVDVITGLIKANMPCRMAFSVASLMDSRTILDTSGAEKLVGKGDSLYMSPQTSKPKRLQQSFVSDEEIKRVVKFLKDACDEDPEYEESVISKPSGPTKFDFNGGDDGDDLFNEAREVVVRAGKASASLLQRRLRVGYARAARLIDLLEEAGIVGPPDGARPREILIDRTTALTENESIRQPADDDMDRETRQNIDKFDDKIDEYRESVTDDDNKSETDNEYQEENNETDDDIEDENFAVAEEDNEEYVEAAPEEGEEEPAKKNRRERLEDEIY